MIRPPCEKQLSRVGVGVVVGRGVVVSGVMDVGTGDGVFVRVDIFGVNVNVGNAWVTEPL